MRTQARVGRRKYENGEMHATTDTNGENKRLQNRENMKQNFEGGNGVCMNKPARQGV